jgi:hypothetical protein
LVVPKRRIRGRRARAKQRPRGRDLRDQYREADLPLVGHLAVVTIDDPYPSLEVGVRLKQAQHPDGSTAEGAPGWTPPPRPRIAVIASLKEDPIGRMAARHQIDRAQFLGAREYQELYDTTQRGTVRTVDLSKTKVSGVLPADPLTDRYQRASQWLRRVDRAVVERHGSVGLALVRAVLCERIPVEKTARAYGAASGREKRNVAWLFRQVLNVVAKVFGFSTSTARPYQAPVDGTGDGGLDPADDPARHADAGDLADSRLRSARGRANGGG